MGGEREDSSRQNSVGGIEGSVSHPLRLTSPQQDAAEEILAVLKREPSSDPNVVVRSLYTPPQTTASTPNLIIVRGHRGTGKDTMLENIRTQINELGGLVLTPTDFLRRDFWLERGKGTIVTHIEKTDAPEIENVWFEVVNQGPNPLDILANSLADHQPLEEFRDKDIILTVDDWEAKVIRVAAKHLLPNHRYIDILVTAILNRGELRTYVGARRNESALTAEQVMLYSMGVPGLVEQLTRSGVEVREAREIAAWYLFSNYDMPAIWEMLQEIIRFNPERQDPITDVAREINGEMTTLLGEAEERREAVILLRDFRERREQLLARGVFEESPDFQTRESLGFYNRLLEENNRSGPYIEVFVPQLNEDELSRIQAFLQARSARLAMFGLKDLWKTQFMLIDTDGEERINSSFPRDIRRKEREFQTRIDQAGTEPGPKRGSLYFLTYDHAKSTGASIKVGWALESLLQQLGIRYGVKYDVSDTIKMYEPDKKAFTIQESNEI